MSAVQGPPRHPARSIECRDGGEPPAPAARAPPAAARATRDARERRGESAGARRARAYTRLWRVLMRVLGVSSGESQTSGVTLKKRPYSPCTSRRGPMCVYTSSTNASRSVAPRVRDCRRLKGARLPPFGGEGGGSPDRAAMSAQRAVAPMGTLQDSRAQTPRTVRGGASASRSPRDRRSNRVL